MRKRTGDPWMPADAYGRSLPRLTINLIVADVERSLAWYRSVLRAEVRYGDPDFAALRIGGTECMLHADHAYESHPWAKALAARHARGLGAELRLYGEDPDGLELRAREAGADVLAPATDKPHGWREVWVRDPDGYVWAVGGPRQA